MSESSKSLWLWGVLVGLLGVQFGVLALGVQYDAYDVFEQYVLTEQKQLAAIVGAVLGGIGIARYGYGRPSRLVQYLGIITMMGGYGLGFQYSVRTGWIDQPFITIEIASVVTTIVLTGLYWFATRSRSQFRTWDARAVVVFLSAVMLTIAGWFVEAILVGAAIVAVFPLVMHLFHVIGFVQDGRVQPIRHGGRLYVAVFGFYAELTLYFIGALKRLR